MATATATAGRREVKEYTYSWEGRDRTGKILKGDMRAGGEAVVQSTLRRQGISVIKVKRQRAGLGGKIKEKDITLFTRQLATMMKAGVPLLQAFDIVGKGHSNPAVGRLLMAIKSKIKAALFYPISIIVVAFVITAVIMIFVIPAFKDLFSSFGADLPGPTLFVIALSDFFVHY